MKTVGIIAEYNPLHNGHRYQLEQARSLTGADFVIAVMSGDFVQRGEPAVYDKYTRTRMALNAGADLVLELPSCFAAGSAEDFASCGVALLDRIGVVDFLCFGSECGQTAPLIQTAGILAQEPPSYQEILREELARGLTFPQARSEALLSILSSGPDPETDWKALLSSPNNILGIEYIKALFRQNSSITPVTIQRSGSGYHDTSLESESVFASASAIRRALSSGDQTHAVRTQMPYPADDQIPVFADDLSAMLNYQLLNLYQKGIDLTEFSDVSRELADRLMKQVLDFQSFSGRIQALKTRQYTYTRISRALLHIFLEIRGQDMNLFRESGYASYARILGFRKTALPLLSAIKANSRIPLISKVANADKILECDQAALLAFQYDLHASHVYQMIRYQKCGMCGKNEFTQPVIVLGQQKIEQ